MSCLMQFARDTYNENFSARKRRKSGNNQTVAICGIRTCHCFGFVCGSLNN